LASSAVYIQLLQARSTSISNVSSDMRARCGRISRPLFENTLSAGADEAGRKVCRIMTRRTTWEVDT